MSGPHYREIELTLINDPPAPIRQAMDSDALAGLAVSIRDHGQLQPIGVVPDGERFTIVYGHRRFLALQIIGDVPARALVFASTSEAMLGAQLAENADREDMGPVDEAIWFAQLINGLDTDTTRLAERLRCSRDYIEGRLELLRGDAVVLEALRTQQIGIGIARTLNTVTHDINRRLLLDMCIHREAKVHTLNQWIAELTATGALAARQAEGTDAPAAGGSDAAAPAPIKCRFCGQSKNPWQMTPSWIHEYCADAETALLARALGESEVNRG